MHKSATCVCSSGDVFLCVSGGSSSGGVYRATVGANTCLGCLLSVNSAVSDKLIGLLRITAQTVSRCVPLDLLGGDGVRTLVVRMLENVERVPFPHLQLLQLLHAVMQNQKS